MGVGAAPAAHLVMGNGWSQLEVRRRLDPTRRSRAGNQRPLAMAICDRASAYRWRSLEEGGKPVFANIGPLVMELRPAEALALAKGELHCDL